MTQAYSCPLRHNAGPMSALRSAHSQGNKSWQPCLGDLCQRAAKSTNGRRIMQTHFISGLFAHLFFAAARIYECHEGHFDRGMFVSACRALPETFTRHIRLARFCRNRKKKNNSFAHGYSSALSCFISTVSSQPLPPTLDIIWWFHSAFTPHTKWIPEW